MTIVAGLQDSLEARRALERAVEIARERGARLLLVGYVAAPTGESKSNSYERERRAMADGGEAIAATYRKEGVDVEVAVPIGVRNPAQAILRVAEQAAAELIVIGMRRRSRVGKLVLGSNAQSILLGADAEVLAVKRSERE